MDYTAQFAELIELGKQVIFYLHVLAMMGGCLCGIKLAEFILNRIKHRDLL